MGMARRREWIPSCLFDLGLFLSGALMLVALWPSGLLLFLPFWVVGGYRGFFLRHSEVLCSFAKKGYKSEDTAALLSQGPDTPASYRVWNSRAAWKNSRA